LSKFPAIPDFMNTPESIGESVRAIKISVELLTGQRQGESIGAPDMFVQVNTPAFGPQTQFRVGDLWINPEAKTLLFWDGQQWQAFV
jgi:hypothetical protein